MNSDLGFDAVIEAVKSVGFPIVAFVLLVLVIVVPILLLLRYVIFDAVRYFTNRLDTMSHDQAVAFSGIADALNRQSDEIAASRETNARVAETMNILVQFVSHTQQEVVAHRSVIEAQVVGVERATAAEGVPSPPYTNPEGA